MGARWGYGAYRREGVDISLEQQQKEDIINELKLGADALATWRRNRDRREWLQIMLARI